MSSAHNDKLERDSWPHPPCLTLATSRAGTGPQELGRGVAVLTVVDRLGALRGVITGRRGGALEVVAVAELTVSREPTKDAARVTVTAGDEAVRARQPKARLVMEEGAREEGVLIVAVLTEGPKAPKVWIPVAARTLWPRPGEGLTSIRAMAALTGEQVMSAADLKGAKVVVDLLVQLPASQ